MTMGGLTFAPQSVLPSSAPKECERFCCEGERLGLVCLLSIADLLSLLHHHCLSYNLCGKAIFSSFTLKSSNSRSIVDKERCLEAYVKCAIIAEVNVICNSSKYFLSKFYYFKDLLESICMGVALDC